MMAERMRMTKKSIKMQWRGLSLIQMKMRMSRQMQMKRLSVRVFIGAQMSRIIPEKTILGARRVSTLAMRITTQLLA